MKKYISFIFLFPVLLFACNGSATKEKREKQSYDVNKKALFTKEESNPVPFLLVSGRSRKNIVGQTVVRGTLINKASVATFKDVDIKLSFYSKTKSLLETDKETIYEILAPGDSRNFKTKYFAPRGTDSVGLQVLGAKVVQP